MLLDYFDTLHNKTPHKTEPGFLLPLLYLISGLESTSSKDDDLKLLDIVLYVALAFTVVVIVVLVLVLICVCKKPQRSVKAAMPSLSQSSLWLLRNSRSFSSSLYSNFSSKLFLP